MFAPITVVCPVGHSLEKLSPEFDQSELYFVTYPELHKHAIVMAGEELDILVNDPANRGLAVRFGLDLADVENIA